MKLLVIVWNCILSLITFSISLLNIFSKMIGWNNLGESYDDLFGLWMIIEVDDLKCNGKYPKFIQTLVILIIETKQLLKLIICFKIFHKILSDPGTEELLYLLMAFLNSFFKNSFHSNTTFKGISSNILKLTW